MERAKEAMVDVAQYINEVKRDSEHMDIIQKVRVSFKFPIRLYYYCCFSLLCIAVNRTFLEETRFSNLKFFT